MNTTLKTTLNCASCVSKVTPGLNRIAGLSEWSVDTADPQKRLAVSVDHPDVINQVVAAVRDAGFEATPEINVADSAERAGTEVAPIGWATYWPLILVLLYIIGGLLFVQWATGHWSWHRAMELFMGLFFLGFAFFKLLDVSKFADAFSSYDLVAARSRGYALAYPFIELALGVAYLFSLFPTATHVATIVVMGVGLIGVVRAVARRQAIQCACLGTAFNLPMSSVTIVENSAMILMAAVMLFAQ